MLSKTLKPIGTLQEEPSSKKILDNIWTSLLIVKKITSCVNNNSLQWIILIAFQGTNAEHVVKESYKAYGVSGLHTVKALKTYYRSNNHQQEVQRRLQKNINNLK